jgi:hypothetical protein
VVEAWPMSRQARRSETPNWVQSDRTALRRQSGVRSLPGSAPSTCRCRGSGRPRSSSVAGSPGAARAAPWRRRLSFRRTGSPAVPGRLGDLEMVRDFLERLALAQELLASASSRTICPGLWRRRFMSWSPPFSPSWGSDSHNRWISSRGTGHLATSSTLRVRPKRAPRPSAQLQQPGQRRWWCDPTQSPWASSRHLRADICFPLLTAQTGPFDMELK